jgi:hypothetical protein
MAATPPRLATRDGQSVEGKSLPINRDGLALWLDIAAGQELDAATSLSLSAAGSEQALTAVLSSDKGAFNTGDAAAWIMADWGEERPLSSLALMLAPTASNTLKARVKVFSGGAWFPLQPVDILAIGAEQHFSPVTAAKALLELVTPGQYPGQWQSASATISGLSLKATPAPGDLTFSAGAQADWLQRPGLLPASAVPIPGLAEAANAWLRQAPPPVPVLISAKTPGQAQIQFKPKLIDIVRQAQSHPDGQIYLPWNQATAARIGLRKDAELLELSFMLASELAAESLLLSAESKAEIAANWAQFCSTEQSHAQAFLLASPGLLSGIDLRLALRGGALQARLSLHPDQQGRPAAAPYAGAELPLNWSPETDPRSPDGWVKLDFPRPLQLPEAGFWIVLKVQQGEAFWRLGASQPTGAGKCLYRQGAGAWLECGAGQWLLTRLRASSPAVPGAPKLLLARGQAQAELSLTPEGAARADVKTLQILNADPADALELRFSAAAAGIVRLQRLRLAYRNL